MTLKPEDIFADGPLRLAAQAMQAACNGMSEDVVAGVAMQAQAALVAHIDALVTMRLDFEARHRTVNVEAGTT